MKPVKLNIVGLNSFKEEQEIDFTRLSDLGMFGIFGPTGSGKSSILDAMTLALFGTVVRAERHKQGIVNHSVTRMHVSFTFALGAGQLRRLYRIDRFYRTKDHVSVQNVHSRLTDVTDGGDAVLAERETEVTACVERLLGIKAEDFTRAVVLPQGSFADFLQLETGKRRAMLERLFSLERYGRRLTDKLSERFDDANTVFNRLDAEQQSLGQISAETLAEAEQQKEYAIGEESAAVRTLAEANAAYEESRLLYALQSELAEKQAALAAHAAGDGAVDELRQAVKRADEADEALTLLTQRDAVAEKLRVADEDCLRLSAEMTGWENQGAVLAGELEAARDERLRQEPHLIARRVELEAVRTVEEEAANLTVQAESMGEGVRCQTQELARIRQAAENLAANLEELTAAVITLEKQAAEAQPTASYRLLLQDGADLAVRLGQDIEQYRACQAEYKRRLAKLTDSRTGLAASEKDALARQQALAALQAAENAARQNCPAEEDALLRQEVAVAEGQVRIREVEERMARLAESRAVAGQAEAELRQAREEEAVWEAALTAARTAWQNSHAELTAFLSEDRRAMAAKLAATLEAGSPCPVCGSSHHPRPADPLAEDIGHDDRQVRLRSAAETLQARMTEAEEARRQAGNRTVSLETRLAGILDGISREEAKLENVRRALAERYDPPLWNASVADLAAKARMEEEGLASVKEQLKAWRSARQEADGRLQQLQLQVSQDEGILAGCRTALAAAEEDSSQSGEALAAAENWARETSGRLGDILVKMGRQAGDAMANIAAMAELRAEAARRDMALEALQSQLETMRSAIGQNRQTLDELYKREKQQAADLAALQARFDEVQARLTDKQSQVQKVTGGVAAAILMAATDSSLAALRRAESDAQERLNGIQTQRELAAGLLTARKTQQSGLREMCQELAASVAAKLVERGFATEADVHAAWIDKAVREEQRQDIKNHEEQSGILAAQCAGVAGKLGGRRISETDWQQVVARRDEAVAARDKATERRITAEQTHNETAVRYRRWLELEKQLISIRAKRQDLDTLRRMTRGNMLVEFMAQEQMDVVVRYASDSLKQLTNNRYALELASDGSFIIRDDENAGTRRPVNTLSGGETFQTSLALALALSIQIQLKGQHPLEFFFLDEGFGSLDQDLLETVMASLERLPHKRLTIGLISHVGALQQRMLRRLIVKSAEPNGRGTSLTIEIA